jgi:hypothetical protein
MAVADLVAYFEAGAAHWIPGTPADLFWRYKEYLDCGEAQLNAKALPAYVLERVFNRPAAEKSVGAIS